jgi:hypothetical protein
VLQRLKRLIYGAIWSRYRHYEDVQNVAVSAYVILLLWYYADYGISSEKPSLNGSVDPLSSDPISSGLDGLAGYGDVSESTVNDSFDNNRAAAGLTYGTKYVFEFGIFDGGICCRNEIVHGLTMRVREIVDTAPTTIMLGYQT